MSRLLVLALMSCLVAAGEAKAATITWEFEAIVRGSTGLSGSTPQFDAYVFQPGQVLRGSVSFDSEVADTDPQVSTGGYPSLLLGLNVEYMYDWINPQESGPYFMGSASSSTTSEMFVASGVNIDRMTLTSGFEPLFPSTSLIRNLHIGLYQQPGGPSLWSSAAMVLTPPLLSEVQPFDLSFFEQGINNGLILSSADNSYRVGAELTLLHAVPEPRDSVLVSMGLLALLGLRRGDWLGSSADRTAAPT